MKLTDETHVLLLTAAGSTPQTATAQVALIKRVERDLVERICHSLEGIPAARIKTDLYDKESFVKHMTQFMKGHI